MDFSLTEEQQIFVKSVESFASKEVAPTVEERERTGEFSRQIWKKMADFGLLGLCVPEQYGGGGADALTTVVGCEAFARGSRDFPMNVVWGSHMFICAMPIVDLGNDTQKEKYLPPLCRGELIGAFALTEPGAGSDATALRTTARKDGNQYILNGTKMFISNAPIADVFFVFARMENTERHDGITTFIVDRDCPGLSVGKELDKYDSKSSPTGEVIFEDCLIPAENLVGEEGTGFQSALSSLGWERIAFGGTLGVMEADLQDCLNYVKERQQFGKPIGKFQLIQAKLADMKVRLEAARLLTYRLAWMKDQGEWIGLESSVAKLFLTEAALESALDGIQIFGGYGCMREYPIGRSLWASKMATIGGGTSEIHRITIARMLLSA